MSSTPRRSTPCMPAPIPRRSRCRRQTFTVPSGPPCSPCTSMVPTTPRRSRRVAAGKLTDGAANDSFNDLAGTLVGNDRDSGETATLQYAALDEGNAGQHSGCRPLWFAHGESRRHLYLCPQCDRHQRAACRLLRRHLHGADDRRERRHRHRRSDGGRDRRQRHADAGRRDRGQIHRRRGERQFQRPVGIAERRRSRQRRNRHAAICSARWRQSGRYSGSGPLWFADGESPTAPIPMSPMRPSSTRCMRAPIPTPLRCRRQT